jgi:hypothetical protein
MGVRGMVVMSEIKIAARSSGVVQTRVGSPSQRPVSGSVKHMDTFEPSSMRRSGAFHALGKVEQNVFNANLLAPLRFQLKEEEAFDVQASLNELRHAARCFKKRMANSFLEPLPVDIVSFKALQVCLSNFHQELVKLFSDKKSCSPEIIQCMKNSLESMRTNFEDSRGGKMYVAEAEDFAL